MWTDTHRFWNLNPVLLAVSTLVLLLASLIAGGCSENATATADSGTARDGLIDGPTRDGPIDRDGADDGTIDGSATDSTPAADQGVLQPPKGLEDLTYLGAFRLEGIDEGDDKRLGYSEGVIALDGQGNLWVTSHTYKDYFAPFPIPATLGATLATAPIVKQGSSWVDVTEGVQQQVSGNRNVRGLLRVGDGWMYTVQEYYNGDGSHDPVLGYEGSGLWKTTHHSQATAGYLARIHPHWQPLLGAEFIAGLAGTTIHQEASHGPVAHAFDLDPGNLPVAGATVATERLAFYPLDNEHPDFTTVSTIRGAAFTRRALYLFGGKGLGEHWYGESPDAGRTDACSSSKGYHSEDRTTWVWVVDPAELEQVKTSGADARIPTLHSASLSSLLKLTQSCATISGAAYDHAAGRIYLATQDFQSSGEPQPAIHVLQVKTP